MSKEDKSWAFNDLTIKDTNYLTHGYHKYPAKFIPQIVSKLLLKYSSEGDWVIDPFGGCGTTLVESKLKNRNSIGIDINDVAVLIAKTKISEIDPLKLESYNKRLINNIQRIKVSKNHYQNANERLKYWFRKKEYNQLMELYFIINRIHDEKIKYFYLCCFSNILKNCSVWYSKSIKPMRDLEKEIHNPFFLFESHLRSMTQRNLEFFNKLKLKEGTITCNMIKGDARCLNLNKNCMDLVITSPPYVTSYEYAELHQLSTLWFGFARDMNEIKSDFVGTSYRKVKEEAYQSSIAKRIVNQLTKKDKSLARDASNYFSDLQKSYSELYRVLKAGGIACIILGNTEYKSVKVKNVEASLELLENLGFKKIKIIKRKLTSKNFTPFRDKQGKFTNSKKAARKTIYKYEYILVMKK
jgi:DNA modification methylase